MFAEYSWGQFALFALVLVGVYYLIIGLLYYRDEMGALYQKKPAIELVGVPAAGRGASSGSPLVRPSSVFAPKPAAPTTAEVTESAADTPQEPAVVGTLPDSTAAATGNDEISEEAAPAATVDLAEAEAEQEALLDEQRVEELDVPNTALAAAIARKAAAEKEISNENFTKATTDENPLPIFTSKEDNAPSVAAYEESTSESNQPLFIGFDSVPGAATLDLSTDVAKLPSAASVADYIASVRSQRPEAQAAPVAPAALVGTSLVDQMASKQNSNMAVLNNLFGDDDE